MGNKLVSENNFLFLKLSEAIDHLKDRTSQSPQNDYVMIVLSEEVVSVANQIAKASGIGRVFSECVHNSTSTGNEIQFDLNTVKSSGRDVPQDYIFHEERNLKANMISRYQSICKKIRINHPNQVIILADSLSSDGLEFRQTDDSLNVLVEKNIKSVHVEGTDEPNVARQFLYLHLVQKGEKGINMLIEQEPL